jgi:hypothetical protein
MEMVNDKAMPGLIPAPKFWLICRKIRKIQVAKWGKPKKSETIKEVLKDLTKHQAVKINLRLYRRGKKMFAKKL